MNFNVDKCKSCHISIKKHFFITLKNGKIQNICPKKKDKKKISDIKNWNWNKEKKKWGR